MMADPAPTSWPLWQRKRLAAERADGEFVDLARYATIDALWGFDENVLPAGLPPREVAARIYREVFARGRWNYVDEPKRQDSLASGADQQIRSPRDIQRHRGATCLDASLLFAALAVRAGVRPHLVVGHDHAFVLIGDEPIGAATATVGIAEADRTTVERIASGEAMAIDVVQVLLTPERAEPRDLAAAVAEGGRLVDRAVADARHLVLIDVARVNEESELAPYTPDRDSSFIPRSLPAHAGEKELYESQERVCAQLRGRSGVIVIHGASGTGKTTAALHLVAEREMGPSLLLDATSGETVAASAAEIAARERGVASNRLDPLERTGDAESLLSRLRTAPGPWCVVFDNADGDPSKVLGLLPRPDPERLQTLIVTTTNPSWFQLKLVDVFETLDPIDPADVERALGDDAALAPLVAGRAVTLRAFLRYLREGDAASLRRHAEGLPDDELRGPAALVNAALDGRDELRPVLRRLALLPPDRLPVSEHVADGDTMAGLERLGLVDLEPGAAARMHRLVGRAIARVLGPDGDAPAAAHLLSHKAPFEALSEAADPDLLGRYTELIKAAFGGRPASADDGLVLQRAASLMEQRGRIGESRDLAELAVKALRAAEGDELIELADALQSLARWTNQHEARNPDALAEALAQMAWAQRVANRLGDERRAARSRRLEALLRLKVGWLEPDFEEGTRQIVAALTDLEHEADVAERSGSGVDPAEALRARFNVAGPRVTLAQRSPSQAGEHLSEADRVYTKVRKGREALYPQSQHPHIAACINGQALVRYTQARLVAVEYEERQRLLAEATNLGREALEDRFQLEGPFGGADTNKSSMLLTKIAYARHRLNGTEVDNGVLVEAQAEAGLPRLTAATTDRRAFAERWWASPQLAAVLRLFGVETPEALDAVAAERTVYDVLETGTIRSAARVSGLMDVTLPVQRVYDQVVVLDSGRFAKEADRVAEQLIAGGEVAGQRVERIDEADSEAVLIITPHLDRVRQLAIAQERPGIRHADALGFMPDPKRPTFGPADYLRELAATSAALREWSLG
jgi:hypothetical protein